MVSELMNVLNIDCSMKISRRWFLGLMLLSACSATSKPKRQSLLIGMMSYEEGSQSLEQYDRFKRYLSEKTQSRIELEPTLNEDKALEKIKSQEWSLVFAPPGLSAIAISQYQYQPLFPLFGTQNLRSVLVVREDSPIRTIREVTGKSVALGKPGSATGYYFPLFNLYGLTVSELMFPPTPKAILDAVAQGKADVGAVSMEEFNSYKGQTAPNLRLLFSDPHKVPSGAILMSPTVDRNTQEFLRKALSEISPVIAEEVGFVTNAPVPDYQYMISVVKRVRSIFPADTRENLGLLQQKPVRLFQ